MPALFERGQQFADAAPLAALDLPGARYRVPFGGSAIRYADAMEA